jgi:hypothetical protein
MNNQILNLQKLLKLGWINLSFKRVKNGWIAVVSDGEFAGKQIGPWLPQKLNDLRLKLAHRYLADVSSDKAFINTRWAMKLPNWTCKFGALRELSYYLIK